MWKTFSFLLLSWYLHYVLHQFLSCYVITNANNIFLVPHWRTNPGLFAAELLIGAQKSVPLKVGLLIFIKPRLLFHSFYEFYMQRGLVRATSAFLQKPHPHRKVASNINMDAPLSSRGSKWPFSSSTSHSYVVPVFLSFFKTTFKSFSESSSSTPSFIHIFWRLDAASHKNLAVLSSRIQ